MPPSATRRLIKDLQKIQKEQSQFIINPLKDDLMLWTVTFEGAQNTIWEGGLFTLKLIFSEQYPNTPPKVKFLNKMFHPNIYNDGRICLDMLNNQWSPIYDVWAILTAIKTLIVDPNPQSPANIEASNIFRDNKVQYEYRVKQIVQKSLQFEFQTQQIIKQTQLQIKQKEIEEAKVKQLQKQRQQRQTRKYDAFYKNPLSYQLKSKSTGFAIRSPGAYAIPSNKEQADALINEQSSQEDSEDYLHSQSGCFKENFTEPAPAINFAVESKSIKLQNIQNKVEVILCENLKKQQKESTEVLLPNISSEIETLPVKLQQVQQKQSNQKSQVKQDQQLLKIQQKQKNQVQQDKNDSKQVRVQEKQDDITKNEGQNNQLSVNMACLGQSQYEQQEQLVNSDGQAQEEEESQSQIQDPDSALESSDQQS